MRMLVGLLVAALGAGGARAQFDLEDAHTTASLRGISVAGPGVAWLSGSDGTVRRTEDGGFLWQICTVPGGAGGAKLDFRAVQAFDANTALVMSSGKGGLSRVFRTTDGCQTWKEVFANPDAEGFFDAMVFSRQPGTSQAGKDPCFGVIVGDPVSGRFPLFVSDDCGERWKRQAGEMPPALKDEGLFAASNSSLSVYGLEYGFTTGGPSGARLLVLLPGVLKEKDRSGLAEAMPGSQAFRSDDGNWRVRTMPLAYPSASAGAFSVASSGSTAVIVGGDYAHPDGREDTAWYKASKWLPAKALPGGYRSSVAYDAEHKGWLTVGPNGADVSFDDGRTWRAVAGENLTGWNAIALPYVVGAKGRVARVREEAWKR